jgi:ankyrin repeat protein
MPVQTRSRSQIPSVVKPNKYLIRTNAIDTDAEDSEYFPDEEEEEEEYNYYTDTLNAMRLTKDEKIQHVNDYYKTDGYTPLMRAVYNNELSIVKRLLKIPGIDVNKYSSQDYASYQGSKRLYDITALGIATMLGYTQIVNELLKVRGIQSKRLYRKNNCSAIYQKFLTESPKIKHQKVHRIMLATLGIIKSEPEKECESSDSEEEDRDSDSDYIPDESDDESVSDSDYEAMSDDYEEEDPDSDSDYEEEDLFDATTINKYDKNGYTPLIRAVYKRDLAQVKRLLRVPGMDVNKFSSNAHHGHYASKYMVEQTALGVAKDKGYTEIATELLKTANPTKLEYYD